uniref:OSJNBa0060B20.1 protein n=1 Tax=Oryza sativa subsp. japonica TaxID=39947 RepID=Q7XX42_ORYSJ|nr:OSJNBa0060B20.1 [Oryza sativa Japonica Group]
MGIPDIIKFLSIRRTSVRLPSHVHMAPMHIIGCPSDYATLLHLSKDQLPPPVNIKGIRSFLGHAGFYRRFIKDFSTIARPLTNLLAKDAPFEFDDVCLKSFEILKKALVSAPIIQPPDWTLPFEIMCDARDFAVGAVLGQTKNKKHHAICYASKTLTGAQFNYSTTEKELLTIVFAIDKFRSYLVGAKVIVYTDHATLIYLFTKKDAKCHVLINSSRIKNHSLKGIIELIKIRKEIGKH